MTSEQKLWTSPIGRLSFPYVFTPRPAMEAGKEDQYECGVILPADTDLSDLKAAIAAVAKAKWSKMPPNLRSPIRDGAEKPDVAGLGEGVVYMTARALRRPSVVDANVIGISDAEEIYGGCYGRIHCSVYAYDRNGNRGVTLGLLSIQKTADGEAFGIAPVDPEAVFGKVAGETSGW